MCHDVSDSLGVHRGVRQTLFLLHLSQSPNTAIAHKLKMKEAIYDGVGPLYACGESLRNIEFGQVDL